MKQLIPSDKIRQGIYEMATQIIHDYPTSPQFIALLRGAAPFAAELMFAIVKQAPEYHPQLDYMTVSTYGEGQTAHAPQIVTDLSPDNDVRDRDVIILDDVLDKGITAQFVTNELAKRQPKSIALAVLVDKETDRSEPIEARYSVASLPDVWLTGMGMDDTGTAKEAYRWSSDIYQVN